MPLSDIINIIIIIVLTGGNVNINMNVYLFVLLPMSLANVSSPVFVCMSGADFIRERKHFPINDAEVRVNLMYELQKTVRKKASYILDNFISVINTQ